MRTYYIYKITNKNNNMSYIGQSVNPQKRLMEHIYGRKNKKDTYIDKTMKKYGIENFIFEIIDSSNNQDEIDKLEKEYIIKYNTLKPNGYNILKGGREQQGAWNSKPIDEYDLDGNYINTYESAGYYSQCINSEYNNLSINHSCRTKRRYKDRYFRYKGDEKPTKYVKPKSTRIKKVYQYDLEGNFIKEYESVTQASKETNTNRTSIINCVNGIYKKANDYVWSYSNKINIDEINPKYDIKTVIYKCNENKEVLEKYNNTREAEIKNNFKYNSYKQILKYLDTNKIYNGYYWYRVKFYEDNIVPSLNEN